jgi:hypothetical protein
MIAMSRLTHASLGWVLLYGSLTLFMAGYGIRHPEFLVPSLAFFLIGMNGTWRHYQALRSRVIS